MLGYEYIQGGRKYKYVFLRGSKATRRKNFKLIEHLIQPYPKKDKPIEQNEKDIIESYYDKGTKEVANARNN